MTPIKFKQLMLYFILGITSMMWQCIDIGDSILFGNGVDAELSEPNLSLMEGATIRENFNITVDAIQENQDILIKLEYDNTLVQLFYNGLILSNEILVPASTIADSSSYIINIEALPVDNAMIEPTGVYNTQIRYTAFLKHSIENLSSGNTILDQDVTILDNDNVGLTIYDSTGTQVNTFPYDIKLREGGTLQDMYQVSLSDIPTADVSVAISMVSTRASIALAGVPCASNACNLTFTTTNWNINQILTLTLTDDTINQDPDEENISIAHNLSSADTRFDGINLNNVMLSLFDDDSPAILFYDASATVISSVPYQVTLNEAGALIGSYQVALQTLPSADVNIAINLPTSDTRISMDLGGAVCNLNTCNLTFTSVNWSTPQIINFAIINDSINQNDLRLALDHTATSTDSDYNGLNNNTDILLIVVDDDSPGFNIYDTTSTIVTSLPHTITLDENTTNQEEYFIDLRTQPTADVTINFTVPADSRLTGYVNGILCPVTGCEVILTSVNWSAPVILEFVLASDDIDNDPSTSADTYNIMHMVTSTDTDYNGQSFDISLTLEDDDERGYVVTNSTGVSTFTRINTPTFVETINTTMLNIVDFNSPPTARTIINPISITRTIQVRLNSEPTSNVNVAINLTSTIRGANRSPASLTFTPANWQTDQPITLTFTEFNPNTDYGSFTLSDTNYFSANNLAIRSQTICPGYRLGTLLGDGSLVFVCDRIGDHFIITREVHLDFLNNIPPSAASGQKFQFVLTTNIDGGTWNRSPIGTNNYFRHHFHGANFTIRNLNINTNQTNVGLISQLGGAGYDAGYIHHLNLADYTIDAGSNANIGGIVGLIIAGEVNNVQLYGNNSITVTSNVYSVGGIIGTGRGDVTRFGLISWGRDFSFDSVARLTITAPNVSGSHLGGYIGYTTQASQYFEYRNLGVHNNLTITNPSSNVNSGLRIGFAENRGGSLN